MRPKPTVEIAVAAAPTTHRDDRGLRVAQLAQAAGAVAGHDVDQELDSPIVCTQRGVEEEPDAEAEDRAGDRAAQQPDGGDHERRQVGVGAEEHDLRDRRDLERRTAATPSRTRGAGRAVG